MIKLRDEDLIAVSGPRACYLHPDDPGKVIKIVRQGTVFRRNNANWQEWRHYNYLLNRHGPLDFVNECFGFIRTNLGEGLMWECVRDLDGDISSTVTDIMQKPGKYDLAAVEKELHRFCGFIIARNIQFFDLNPLNVLIRIRGESAYEAVCADIKGRYANHEFIPVSTYIPYFSKRKIKRRCKELTHRFDAFLINQKKP